MNSLPATMAWVACGGALGAMLRVGISLWIGTTHLFPWATLGINIAGSLLIGLAWGAWANADWFVQWGRLFLVAGLLGGFTTFSAFSLEVLHLIQTQKAVLAAAYVTASVGLCVIAVTLGERIGQVVQT